MNSQTQFVFHFLALTHLLSFLKTNSFLNEIPSSAQMDFGSHPERGKEHVRIVWYALRLVTVHNTQYSAQSTEYTQGMALLARCGDRALLGICINTGPCASHCTKIGR